MARSVYFSFHYSDVIEFRVNVVRNSRDIHKIDDTSLFIDKSLWEESAEKDFNSLRKIIDDGLKGCGVTVVLVGNHTAERRWVKYEIIKSFTEGKGLLVVHINRIKTRSERKITRKGANPFDRLRLLVDKDCEKVYFQELINRKWVPFKDIPFVNNRLKNSKYFRTGHIFRRTDAGKVFRFSELFQQEYCWVQSNGYVNFTRWIERAAEQVNR